MINARTMITCAPALIFLATNRLALFPRQIFFAPIQIFIFPGQIFRTRGNLANAPTWMVAIGSDLGNLRDEIFIARIQTNLARMSMILARSHIRFCAGRP